MRTARNLVVGMAGLALSGCVAAVPVAPTYTVIPGQGKTEANLRADDAVCRGSSAGTAAAATTTQGVAVTADQYYQCMASRGQAVIQEQPQAYPAYSYAAPAYVPYAYPAVAAYPYPYYGYGYGYGYPYGAGYFGPYVGFGVGFGYGRFYGGHGGFRGGYGYGGYRGGYGGGFHGYGGGFHGGGGGFHR